MKGQIPEMQKKYFAVYYEQRSRKRLVSSDMLGHTVRDLQNRGGLFSFDNSRNCKGFCVCTFAVFHTHLFMRSFVEKSVSFQIWVKSIDK
jgi:hypothetical protein